MKRTTYIFLFAILLAVGLGYFGPSLDDHSEEWRVSQTILDAQEAAIKEEEKQRNAQAFCRATAGEAVVAWGLDGEFTCKARRVK